MLLLKPYQQSQKKKYQQQNKKQSRTLFRDFFLEHKCIFNLTSLQAIQNTKYFAIPLKFDIYLFLVNKSRLNYNNIFFIKQYFILLFVEINSYERTKRT